MMKDSHKNYRKRMMRILAETSINPANSSPSQLEELALFMVSTLSPFQEIKYVNPENPKRASRYRKQNS